MRNPVFEQALDRQGVKWRYEGIVPLADIDAAKGLRTQARLEQPLDNDLVEQYAVAMRAGDQFPPLVLWRPGKGRWTPLDGNQRLAAHAVCKHKHADAYVVETPDQMVADRLCWSFNNLVNGKRLSPDECLHHAVTFVRKYAMTFADAAKEWGIPPHRVKNAVKCLEVREALERQSVRHQNLTDQKIIRLAPLESAGEDVLAKAADAVAKNGMTEEQCLELVARARAARTQEDKVQAVQAFAASEEITVQRAQTKGGTAVYTTLPRDRVAALVGQMARLLASYPDVKVLRPVPQAKFKAVRSDAETVVNTLTLMFGLGSLPGGGYSA